MAMITSNNPFPVKPTGFLIGSFLACGLYGAHLSQIYQYFGTFSDPWSTRCLVLWVWSLSTCQILIIIGSAWRYYVGGISNPDIWQEFWWPLSFQDGLVPIMAFTAQLYFGHRAWRLWGRRKWIAILVIIMPGLTVCFGIALAITARLWAQDPWVSAQEFSERKIGWPSQVVAIVWMALSAATDGLLTFALCWRFFKARRSNNASLVWRLVSLTLETVLLTHAVGATMCIIFLASPPDARTGTDIFWVLLEIVTELYALSILFTINSRKTSREKVSPESQGSVESIPMGQTALDRRVEGYQGSTPFGVDVSELGYSMPGFSPVESLHIGQSEGYSVDSNEPKKLIE